MSRAYFLFLLFFWLSFAFGKRYRWIGKQFYIEIGRIISRSWLIIILFVWTFSCESMLRSFNSFRLRRISSRSWVIISYYSLSSFIAYWTLNCFGVEGGRLIWVFGRAWGGAFPFNLFSCAFAKGAKGFVHFGRWIVIGRSRVVLIRIFH